MKKSVLLIVGLIVLTGCNSSKSDSGVANSSSSIESTTSESKDYYFEVYGKEIRYVNNGKQIELRGTGKPNSTVTIYKKSKDKENKIKDSNIGTDSKFLLIVDAPELMEEYFLTNGSKDVTIKLYSEKEFLKLQEAEKNKMLEESRDSEEKQKTLDSQSREKQKIIDSQSVEKQTSLDEEKSTPSTEEKTSQNVAKQNAEKFPADSVATFKGSRFKGMDYFIKGIVKDKVTAQSVANLSEESYLLQNDRGYIMIVTPPYPVDIPNGCELEVEGHLNGTEYVLKSTGIDSINKNAALINANKILINGKELGIQYFSPEDL